MTGMVQTIGHRIVGAVEEVFADRISALVDTEAPHTTALNSGVPIGFPRINGYVLIPNEGGATTCIVSSVRIERLPYPKRKGTQQDFGLVDLPFPSRLVTLIPIGTLKASPREEGYAFQVHRGVDVFPSVGDPIHLPSAEQLRAIVEGDDEPTRRILIGHCPTAGRAPVYVDPDKLFGRHVAILGNTGAGKSCTVAGLIRWSLEAAKSQMDEKPNENPNARFIVLDPNGEYAQTFRDQGIRLFRVDPAGNERALRLPAWLWNGAEWAAFAGAAPGVQRPVLFEALRRLRSGLGSPDEFETKVVSRIRRYQTRLKLLVQGAEHQQPGRREGVAEVLLNLHSDFEDLAQNSKCTDESLRSAVAAVASKAKEVEEGARANRKNGGGHWHNDFAETAIGQVTDALQQAADLTGKGEDADPVTDEGLPIPFAIDALPDYVDALAADRSGRDMAQFVDTLNLRIHGLLSGERLKSVIHPADSSSITLEDWLSEYIGDDQAKGGTVAVLDLSLVPSEVINIVVSVLARMIFEALQRYRRERGEELPTTLVLEEAHTFVHRDLGAESASPAGRECARVFERIAREGRKFGLGLVLASQRPSEVSPTVLSQCNTFLLHRLVNDRDQDLVKRLVPDGLGPLLRELPSLPTRRAILLGWAAPAPTLVEIRDVPEDHRPHSPDPAFWDVWAGNQSRSINWAKIARAWQGGDRLDSPE